MSTQDDKQSAQNNLKDSIWSEYFKQQLTFLDETFLPNSQIQRQSHLSHGQDYSKCKDFWNQKLDVSPGYGTHQVYQPASLRALPMGACPE